MEVVEEVTFMEAELVFEVESIAKNPINCDFLNL